MKVAVTGGTGFIGRHLAADLAAKGHEVVVAARGIDQRSGALDIAGRPGVQVVRAGVGDVDALASAFAGCDAVAHCAGINRETGDQTYQSVHVEGTANVVTAAETAGVTRLAAISFLRARPACGSAYHESKWETEEIVRKSSLDWTVLKPGLVYGSGDHFLDHLTKALYTFPFYVGIGGRRVRPLWIDDMVRVLAASIEDGRLIRKTAAVLGPVELGFDDAVRTVARVLDRPVRNLRLPLAFHWGLAWVAERVMVVPLVSSAQIRMLKEEIVEPVLAADPLPDDLLPTTDFNEAALRRGLPEPGGFALSDLRFMSGRR